MKVPNHLFVSSGDGALYDTRAPQWSKDAPLRADYCTGHRDIKTVAQFKSTLRNGAFAWPGGYQMYLICSDGAPLCFACGRKELRAIIPAIADKDRSGWRVVACDINYEDSELTCSHCDKAIPAAYGDSES